MLVDVLRKLVAEASNDKAIDSEIARLIEAFKVEAKKGNSCYTKTYMGFGDTFKFVGQLKSRLEAEGLLVSVCGHRLVAMLTIGWQ